MSSSPPPLNSEDSALRLETQGAYLRIQSVAVFVRDLDRSVGFYVDKLGFNLAFDFRTQSRRPVVGVAPPDGVAILMLCQPQPDSAETKLIGRATQVVFVTEDVVAKFREWRRRGVEFLSTPRLRRLQPRVKVVASRSPSQEHTPIWGGIFTRFKDPDGNSFSLVSFDEVNREIEAQRRARTEQLEFQRRTAHEMEIAKQVQARLFPQCLPPLQSLEYAGICLQARPVGGDYYDFLDLGRDRLGLVIGDVAGKGIAAALLMANLQANLRSQCVMASDQPERFLRSANQLFYENTVDSAYATLFFAEYCDAARHLRYANCGHVSGLLLRHHGALERLRSTCTVLGLFKEWDCGMAECELFPGDTLALYTDGITESFSASGEEFGEERLCAAMQSHSRIPAAALLDAIVSAVQNFSPQEQHDDITLIVAKCREV
ncbi:putative Response regulator receiver modulated serine phosphatase [Acidobacteriia bacterium SbA2]|nr:putative Response regulator receiver modulated serine phosphatase [Acidobacteriia bacterium SbA2]